MDALYHLQNETGLSQEDYTALARLYQEDHFQPQETLETEQAETTK
jgi:hypothetical protein